MKIRILNGNPKTDHIAFDSYLVKLIEELERLGHEVSESRLRDLELKDCIGCYGCWLKTPGLCVHKDDMPEVIRGYLNADLVIYASPLKVGFVSALLKRAQERMLPIIHPYLKIEGDRMTHLKRYEHYPRTALILDDLSKANQGTLEMLNKVYEHGGSQHVLTRTMEKNVEELAHEINSL